MKDRYVDYRIVRDNKVLFSSLERKDCRKKFNWFKEHYVSGVIEFVQCMIEDYELKTTKIIDTANLTELHKEWHEHISKCIKSAIDSYCERYRSSLNKK